MSSDPLKARHAQIAALPLDQTCGGHLSNEEVAVKVRMLMRHDLDHEAVCTIARDRIVWLAGHAAELEAALSSRQPPRDDRQDAVHAWCTAAFGDDHAKSIKQRGVRLAEEAIEAAQAAGVSPQMLHRLVDHIYAKEPGELRQEIGGVGVTLLALAEAAEVSADHEEQREFNRVLSKPLSFFAARNEAKNAAGFNVLADEPTR
jgi:hypothetical protein